MPREVFPLEEDRAIITAFLEGKQNFQSDCATTCIRSGALLCVGLTGAHYDTGGSLVGMIVDGNAFNHYAVHATNYMLEQLGDETRLTRETRDVRTDYAGSPEMETRWFLGDQPITPGVPFVIAGPMTIMAWRAARGIKPKRVR